MSNSLRVVMLSTEKASNLFKSLSTGNLIVGDMSPNNNPSTQNQHLYLIDENAAVQVGDYHLRGKILYRKANNAIPNGHRIIASTDDSLGLPTFSDDLIQQYVANPNMEISGYTTFNNELVISGYTIFEGEEPDDEDNSDEEPVALFHKELHNILNISGNLYQIAGSHQDLLVCDLMSHLSYEYSLDRIRFIIDLIQKIKDRLEVQSPIINYLLNEINGLWMKLH